MTNLDKGGRLWTDDLARPQSRPRVTRRCEGTVASHRDPRLIGERRASLDRCVAASPHRRAQSPRGEFSRALEACHFLRLS